MTRGSSRPPVRKPGSPSPSQPVTASPAASASPADAACSVAVAIVVTACTSSPMNGSAPASITVGCDSADAALAAETFA